MRRVERITPAFVIAVFTSSLVLGEVTSEPSELGTANQIGAIDAIDFYYYSGRPFRLDRSLREIVIRFRTESAAEQQNVIDALARDVRLGPKIVVEGRAFHLAALQRQARDVAEVIAVLKRVHALGQIDFAASVFYHPDTGARLVPTDEIIVKLKTGMTRADLDDSLSARGLAVARGIVGSADEYVLRLPPTELADPLAEARMLHESGRFEWVEPNFVQQLDKQENPR